MKMLLILAFTLSTLSGYAQSYLIINNGVTLTIDSNGFLYDFGHFYLPYKIKHNGGQFFVEEEKLITIDSRGLLFEKDLEVTGVNGKGINYFINSDDELITIDKDGYYFKYDEDTSVFKKAVSFGGNFFLVKPEKRKSQIDIYTINEKGNYFKMNLDGLNPSDISVTGGNFFQTRDGKMYTVSKAGFIFSKSEIKVSAISKIGGNFFIDANGLLHTVSDEGFLVIPSLPKNLVVSDIQKIGSHYMLDKNGNLFCVDKNGDVFERKGQHDLRNVKVLSL